MSVGIFGKMNETLEIFVDVFWGKKDRVSTVHGVGDTGALVLDVAEPVRASNCRRGRGFVTSETDLGIFSKAAFKDEEVGSDCVALESSSVATLTSSPPHCKQSTTPHLLGRVVVLALTIVMLAAFVASRVLKPLASSSGRRWKSYKFRTPWKYRMPTHRVSHPYLHGKDSMLDYKVEGVSDKQYPLMLQFERPKHFRRYEQHPEGSGDLEGLPIVSSEISSRSIHRKMMMHFRTPEGLGAPVFKLLLLVLPFWGLCQFFSTVFPSPLGPDSSGRSSCRPRGERGLEVGFSRGEDGVVARVRSQQRHL